MTLITDKERIDWLNEKLTEWDDDCYHMVLGKFKQKIFANSPWIGLAVMKKRKTVRLAIDAAMRYEKRIRKFNGNTDTNSPRSN
jgi:hypothetical protein